MAKHRMDKQITKVRLNSPKSVSVETTIPGWIAMLMKLRGDDFIEWEYDQVHDRAIFFKGSKKPKS